MTVNKGVPAIDVGILISMSQVLSPPHLKPRVKSTRGVESDGRRIALSLSLSCKTQSFRNLPRRPNNGDQTTLASLDRPWVMKALILNNR